jgi:hypothetical protein
MPESMQQYRWGGYQAPDLVRYGSMDGLEDIPGIQNSPGVMVEKPFEFREEPAAITSRPEELELATFGSQGISAAPTGDPREYWTLSQINQLMTERDVAPTPVRLKSGPGLSGPAVPADEGKDRRILWIVLGLAGVAFLASKMKG